jgi:cyclopropane fatty-acyl-phospholipid synthase-like methyltransferase
MQKLWWNLVYVFGRTPWDTGITPPEVRAVVEGRQVEPGRALDLGCGTGTNVIYLAQHGFDVTGVDLSARAIARARRKIKLAGLAERARVYAGDVARLDTLPVTGMFDLAVDIGCLHVVDRLARPQYAAGLTTRLNPSAMYMLYAFSPCLMWRNRRMMGISPEEVQALFTPALTLLHVDYGQDRGGAGSAWYTFKKNPIPHP